MFASSTMLVPLLNQLDLSVSCTGSSIAMLRIDLSSASIANNAFLQLAKWQMQEHSTALQAGSCGGLFTHLALIFQSLAIFQRSLLESRSHF
ncbi:hypothetical protein BJX66DRAFT_116879 [Aspergillus keveii]|uniref:Uncharacterized protein n=1 Tax=Aspergillus keveii TaxID=714993 RepID=A0ABR4GD33_9EURO